MPSSPAADREVKAERRLIGEAVFKLLHGTNTNRSSAFGKCVAKLASP